MKEKKIGEVKAYILDRLNKELPAHLSYHSVDHILDVYEACEKIALSEGVGEHDLELLLIAALFHDAGFITGGDDHEERSCVIAMELLPQFGYEDEDMQKICGMIRATKIPQDPNNLLEEIICDADLDYLGRDDFEEIGSKLFDELKYLGVLDTVEEWDQLQIRFLEQHHYYTRTSIQTRMTKKEEHLSILKSKYGQ